MCSLFNHQHYYPSFCFTGTCTKPALWTPFTRSVNNLSALNGNRSILGILGDFFIDGTDSLVKTCNQGRIVSFGFNYLHLLHAVQVQG